MENNTKKKHGRSIARERAFKSLYSFAILEDDLNVYSKDNLANEMVKETIENMDTIDKAISKHLRKWTLSELNQVNLSILRISVYEIKYTEINNSIIINEALELAKKYSDMKSKNFIHGVLDNIAKG